MATRGAGAVALQFSLGGLDLGCNFWHQCPPARKTGKARRLRLSPLSDSSFGDDELVAHGTLELENSCSHPGLPLALSLQLITLMSLILNQFKFKMAFRMHRIQNKT